MAKSEAEKLAAGVGDPDLQDDIIDSQQQMGLDAEERQLREEGALEKLDVLEGLRQMQTADPIRWKVYRYGHEEAKYNGFLGEMTTTALTQENLRKRYGGGSYRVRGFFSSGGYAAQRQVHIAGESILYIPETVNSAATMQPNAPSAFNLSEFMTSQEVRDEKRREADQRRAEEEDRRAERRSKENRDFLLAIGAVVAPIITAVVSKVSSPAPTTDVAALVTALKKDDSPMTSMKGMLEVMTLMKGIVAPESGGGSELAEIINAVTPIAGPALQAFANRPVPAQRPRIQQPNPTQRPTTPSQVAAPAQPPKQPPVTIEATPIVAPAQPVPGEQPTVLQASTSAQNSGVDLSAPSIATTPEQRSMFAQLKPQVDTLVQLARDGQKPEDVGEMFYEQFLSACDDDLYDRLCDLFEDPKTIDRIAIFNSGVKEFRPFFETLQETIVRKIKHEASLATVQNTESTSEPIDS